MMNATLALQMCLVLHLTGLVMMAGMSIADFVAYNNFWKQYALDREKGLAIFNASAPYQKFLAFGAVLLLITGVGMMALTHGVFGEQLWMRIKICLVVLILINGPILGKAQGLKLKNLLLNRSDSAGPDQLVMLKGRLRLMSIANLVFLATIVVLSIFKFN
jgi:hypothetical protein